MGFGRKVMLMNNRRTTIQGFTLIEIMVVVVIIAILAAIALPTYTEQMRKTRRADAKTALLRLADLQERWYLNNNQYTANIADLWAVNDLGGYTSEQSYYRLAVRLGASNQEFIASATVVAGSAQAGDAACNRFQIDQTGGKRANPDTNGDCWD